MNEEEILLFMAYKELFQENNYTKCTYKSLECDNNFVSGYKYEIHRSITYTYDSLVDDSDFIENMNRYKAQLPDLRQKYAQINVYSFKGESIQKQILQYVNSSILVVSADGKVENKPLWEFEPPEEKKTMQITSDGYGNKPRPMTKEDFLQFKGFKKPKQKTHNEIMLI